MSEFLVRDGQSDSVPLAGAAAPQPHDAEETNRELGQFDLGSTLRMGTANYGRPRREYLAKLGIQGSLTETDPPAKYQ